MSWKTGDAELNGGEIRRTGEDKGRAEMERVVVYDNDDNRYLGNQVTIEDKAAGTTDYPTSNVL